jgi:hypothetical protein
LAISAFFLLKDRDDGDPVDDEATKNDGNNVFLVNANDVVDNNERWFDPLRLKDPKADVLQVARRIDKAVDDKRMFQGIQYRVSDVKSECLLEVQSSWSFASTILIESY